MLKVLQLFIIFALSIKSLMFIIKPMRMPDTPTSEPSRKRRRFNRRLSFWIALLILVILIADYIHIRKITAANQRNANKSVPVVVAKARTENVPVYLTELGTVTPTYTITVRTQINGQLLRVLYTEGQMVKAGDLLAEIDPRPYQAQLIQYEGQLERDKALLANALIDLKRYQTLWKQDSVAQQTLATQQALVQQDEGNVQTDQGLIQATKLNLIYCEIKSPVDGRVGLRLVDPGNYVQISDTTGLAVIATISPITVIFSIPEDNIPDVMDQLNAAKTLTVQAYDRQQNQLLSTGTLLTVDNEIDTTTGTVKLRAQFQNTDGHLFPNQFVNAALLVKTLNDVILIPTAAIQHGVQGDFVYLLNSDKTVSVKPIVTDVVSGNNSVVKSGLTSAQSVVIEGADKLTDGATVTVADPKTHPAAHPS